MHFGGGDIHMGGGMFKDFKSSGGVIFQTGPEGDVGRVSELGNSSSGIEVMMVFGSVASLDTVVEIMTELRGLMLEQAKPTEDLT